MGPYLLVNLIEKSPAFVKLEIEATAHSDEFYGSVATDLG